MEPGRFSLSIRPIGQLQAAQPFGGPLGFLREAQLKTLSLPNTGMAVIIDIGEAGNIHPADKLDVGLRLALAAKHIAYGQDLVYSGPIYDSMKVEGNKIRLTFKQTGSGLQMSAPPWTPTGTPAPAPTNSRALPSPGPIKIGSRPRPRSMAIRGGLERPGGLTRGRALWLGQ